MTSIPDQFPQKVFEPGSKVLERTVKTFVRLGLLGLLGFLSLLDLLGSLGLLSLLGLLDLLGRARSGVVAQAWSSI